MKHKELDQFYTKEILAQQYYSILKKLLEKEKVIFDLWLEPSAGAGAFFNLLPENKIGIDLDPKSEKIIQHDFLTYDLGSKSYITIGNPPFGKNSSLAIKFFNKCAEKSLYIGFVLPKTFKKRSVISKLNPFFHLMYEEDLPSNAFVYNGESYDVPCVFQIWKKENIKRIEQENELLHEDFIFTTKDNAHFAIQRVGVNAGKVKIDFEQYAVASHYFIKINDNEKIEWSRGIFEKIDWSSVKYNTAGNPSISKGELIKLYKKAKNNE